MRIAKMGSCRAATELSFVLCAALLLVGCGFNATASEPAPPVVAASQVPGPAGTTAPPSPPETPQPAGAEAGALGDALANTRGVKNYRMTLDITTSASSGDASSSDVFLSMQGVVVGASSHITYSKGSFNDLLGGGDLIEVVNSGQRTYLRGSRLFGASDPAAWYALPDSEMTRIPFDAWYLLTLTGIDARAAHAADKEMRDGMPCTNWTTTFTANALKLLELSAPPGTSTDFSAVERADARLLACPDGFVHAIEFDVSAHIPDRPAERYGTAVRLRLFDFNARTLVVAAPSGAIEVK
jgi:hypothetical protein